MTPSRLRWLVTPLLVAIAVALFGRAAVAATRVHALVIGNNAPLVGANDSSSEARPLRYADDDAAAFHELIAQVADSTHLLSVLDERTQRAYPGLVARTRVPTLAAVELAAQQIAGRVSLDHQAGHRSAVFVFFSGHGSIGGASSTGGASGGGSGPALALFDGGMSQQFLYERVLTPLAADVVHVIVDACHAEAIVRPRDGEVEVVSVTPEQSNAMLVQSTLRRFPHVGAIVAAATGSASHEWDALEHGIFTYELLSALRGAADVNRDRQVEYSEVVAFMSSANREIADPRARLSVVAKPPDVDRRAVMMHLSAFPRRSNTWLANVPGEAGKLELEDARGRPLLTLHGSSDHVADVLIPAGSTIFVRRGSEEARFRAAPGGVTSFNSLAFATAASQARGALSEAVHRGLFSGRFGRSYYQGFVDQSEGFTPVDFSDAGPGQYFEGAAGSGRFAHELVVLGGMSDSAARSLNVSHGARIGLRPATGNGLMASLEVVTVSDGPLREWRASGSAGWLWGFQNGPVHAWAGGSAGAGVIAQVVDVGDTLASAAFSAGPLVGLSADLVSRLGMWSELQLVALAHRRDDRMTVTLAPSAWLGASLGF